MVFVKFWTKVAVKKAYKSNRLLQKERQYDFSEENIKIIEADSKGEICYGWNDLYLAKQTKDFFVLMIGSNVANIIPKRLVKPEQIKDLEELIKRKLGHKAFPKERYIFWTRNIFRGIAFFVGLTFSIELITDIIFK